MKSIGNLLFVVLLLLVISCEKDEPKIPDEEELITTMIYTLTPEGGGAAAFLRFKDLDGDGGDAPTISSDVLAANTTYTGDLDLLNELESPAESITDEISEEDKEHQFFFETAVAGLAVAYADQDGDGNPLGLKTTLTTAGAGSGTLRIILRHEPDKDGNGVKEGDITNAGGETDIEVLFDVVVQ